jgi:hypothetical protein
MEITITTGWWIWKRTRTFVGDATVWHDKVTGKRPSSHIESRLSELAWSRRQNARITEIKRYLEDGREH